MIGNPKSSPSTNLNDSIDTPIDTARAYLDAFRIKFASNPEVLIQIDLIEKKLAKVRD